MYLLIDHDNINERDLRHGLERVASVVADELGPIPFEKDPRLQVRVYGGWFRGEDRSARAKRILSELAGSFQTPLVIARSGKSVRLTMSAALADSLLSQPKNPILDTYREGRVDLSRLALASSPFAACVAPGACSLHAIAQGMKDGSCPVLSCSVSLAHIATRNEQKLVDTMLVADMMELGRQQAKALAVISSDDDLWPGILSAMLMGTHVFHFQSRSRATPPHYTGMAPTGKYSPLILPAL